MNLHTGAKPYACSICGKTFSLRSARFKHESIHEKKIKKESTAKAPQPNVECPVCHRILTNKRCLNRHMIVHAEVTYKCKVCGQVFLSGPVLERHKEKIHQGTRSFRCSECGKA